MTRKKAKTIPSVIGLLLLTTLILSGIYLTQRIRTTTDIAATGQPISVRIANISDQSVTICWLTEEPAAGSIKINSKVFLDNRDRNTPNQLGRYFTHHIILENLKDEELYRFAIISEGQTYQEDDYQFTTSRRISNLAQEADLAFGIILNQQSQPLPDALVTLSLTGAANLTTITDKSGFWSIPLSTAYKKDLSGLVDYDHNNQIIEIVVESQPRILATMITNTGNDHPVPPITIGQTYNFSQKLPIPKQKPEDFDWNNPEIINQINGSQLDEPSPQKTTNQENDELVNISNPEEGETILTTKPEFTGQGPANKKIKIIIESGEKFEEEITVSGFGHWQWTPPKHLTPGEHAIAIEYYDDDNILHTIKKNFIVQAASVSPSPTPITPLPTQTTTTPTPITILSPTLIPVSTITPSTMPKTTPQATGSAQIVSGSLTPLIILAMLGLGLIYLAFTIQRKSL